MHILHKHISCLNTHLQTLTTFVFVSAMTVDGYIPAEGIFGAFCSHHTQISPNSPPLVFPQRRRHCDSVGIPGDGLPRPFGLGDRAARRPSSEPPRATAAMVYVHSLAPEHVGTVGKNTLKQSVACSQGFTIGRIVSVSVNVNVNVAVTVTVTYSTLLRP